MQIGEYVAELACDVDYQAFGQWLATLSELLFQVTTFNIFHHQVMAVLVIETVADRWNGGMLQLGESISLAGEVFVGLQALLGIDKVVNHFFDGAWTVRQALIMRQVDHPHAAAAQQAFNSVSLLQYNSRLERSR
jgi:hypothetical protein